MANFSFEFSEKSNRRQLEFSPYKLPMCHTTQKRNEYTVKIKKREMKTRKSFGKTKKSERIIEKTRNKVTRILHQSVPSETPKASFLCVFFYTQNYPFY